MGDIIEGGGRCKVYIGWKVELEVGDGCGGGEGDFPGVGGDLVDLSVGRGDL